MKRLSVARSIVGLLFLTNVVALLHWSHQLSTFHTTQAFFACAGLLVFLALQGFFLVKQSKLVISVILLASLASFGLHIGWRVFEGSALSALFLNLEYTVQPGSVLGLLGVGDHESFLVMLEPVLLYGFVLASLLGLLPQTKHDFANAKSTSPTGEYVHNPKLDRNGKPMREDGYNRREHLYHIFASTPAKSAQFKATAFAYLAFFSIFPYITCYHFWNVPVAVLVTLALDVGMYFILFKAPFIKDKRIRAHDTWVYFNTAHLVTPSDIRTDATLDIPMNDIKRFCVRPTTRADGSMVEATYTPSSAMGSALLSGGAGEYFFGTAIMPGSVGLAMSGVALGATAIANTATGVMTALMNGMARAREEHKKKIAEHSFVFELEMKNGKIHTLAGGLNEETATRLMREVAKYSNEDYKAFKDEVEQRTREQMKMFEAISKT